MKTYGSLVYTLVLTSLVFINVLNNSEDARTILRHAAVQLIDGMYWSLYWLEGVEEQNNKSGYMSGNWVPVEQELTNIELTDMEGVEGVPLALAGGAFYRIGTNLRCWPPSNVHHPFNGDAMIHRIEMTNSTLMYSNSWVEESWESRDTLLTLPTGNNNNNNIMCSTCAPTFSFGDVNAGGLALLRLLLIRLRARVLVTAAAAQERSQAGPTNIISLDQKIFAVSEVTLPFQIDLQSGSSTAAAATSARPVVPVGFSDLDGLLGREHNRPGWNGPEEAPMSAHPRTDPRTGETFFFSANHGPNAQPIVNFVRVPANNVSGMNRTRLQIPVPGRPAAFYHDMFLTENYAVVVHSSLKRDPARLARGQSINYFDETEPLRFGVLPRNARSAEEMIWIDAPRPGHIWHTVTGREEGNDTLVLYAPKFDAYADQVDIHLATEEPSYLTRFLINLTDGACAEARIFDEVVERPTVNPNRISHRYAYLRSEGLASQETGRRIVKFDLLTERMVGSFSCGAPESGCLFGEALFVPRSVANETLNEDDGFLMDIVYVADAHSSRFSVWSAESMEERPLLSANLPQRVPHGAHGAWFQSSL